MRRRSALHHSATDQQRWFLKWLAPSLAAVELNQYPRVGWKITDPIRRQVETTSAMATQIPVGLMAVPRGPTWSSNLLGGIVDLLPVARR